MKITPMFAWYDLWVGLFWDRKAKALYVFPLPMLGVRLSFGMRTVPANEDHILFGERQAIARELDEAFERFPVVARNTAGAITLLQLLGYLKRSDKK